MLLGFSGSFINNVIYVIMEIKAFVMALEDLPAKGTIFKELYFVFNHFHWFYMHRCEYHCFNKVNIHAMFHLSPPMQ